MDPRLTPLADTLKLNTRLFRNCLTGLGDRAAQARPSGSTNSAAFVAAHLVDSRFYTLGLLGLEQPSPLKGAEGGFNDITKVNAYPTLGEIQTAWNAVSDALDQRLAALSAKDVDAPLDPGFPVEPKTLLGVLTFMVQHDSYHLGQLGLLRKHAGLAAMGYD